MKKDFFLVWRSTIGSCLLLFCWSAWPNTHEHLTSWFQYEALANAYEKSYQEPFSQIKFRFLTAKGTTDQTQKLITGIWGPEIWQQLVTYWSEATLADTSLHLIGQFIGKLRQLPPTQVLEGFFRFNNANLHNLASYVAIEDGRKSLFKQLRNHGGTTGRQKFQQFFLQTSEETIRAQKGIDVHRLELSISGELMGPEIEQLAQLLRRYRVQTSFFLAYPRYKLLEHDDATFRRYLQMLNRGHQEGILTGIDIAGSINEHLSQYSYFPPDQASKLRERLAILFHWAQNQQGKIKIHAFESARTGAFYQILFQVMADYQGNNSPINVTWGHVNQVEQADLQRLISLQQQASIWRWRFDANFHSARVLHSLAARKVGEKISMIWASGIPVSLGTDGQGIWKTSESDLSYAFHLLGGQRYAPFYLVFQETLGLEVNPLHINRYQVAFNCQQDLAALRLPVKTKAQGR